MAVKVTIGQICTGFISKSWYHQEYYLCGKFHTCITNSTGLVLCHSITTHLYLVSMKFKKFNRIIYWLTILLMLSDKHDSKIAKATGLFFHYSMSLCPKMCNWSSSNACIIGYLCSPLFSISFFTSALVTICRAPCHGFIEDIVTAVIAKVFLTPSFCLKLSVKC